MLLHCIENSMSLTKQVSHTAVRVRGGTGWIELQGIDMLTCRSLLNILHGCIVGEVQGHERCETMPRPFVEWLHAFERVENAAPVSQCERNGGDGRPKVRHHDCPPKMPGSIRYNHFEGITITQVHMPVIGPSDCQCLQGSIQIKLT